MNAESVQTEGAAGAAAPSGGTVGQSTAEDGAGATCLHVDSARDGRASIATVGDLAGVGLGADAGGAAVSPPGEAGSPESAIARHARVNPDIAFRIDSPACRAPSERIAKRGLAAIDRDRPIARKLRVKLRAVLKRFFREAAKDAAEQCARFVPEANEVGKADIPVSLLSGLPGLDLSKWEKELPDKVSPILQAMAISGGESALKQIGLFDKAAATRLRSSAIEWAEQRAAEMVGMRRVAGALVPNPAAEWRITDSVRVALRDAVSQAIGEGESAGGLASRIVDDFAFSGTRAEMIARTEIALADVAGTIEGYRESGVVAGKQWITAQDERVSDECQACERQGTIPLDAEFVTGALAPPNHPNCRCDVLPVFGDEMPGAVASQITGE